MAVWGPNSPAVGLLDERREPANETRRAEEMKAMLVAGTNIRV